MRNFSMLLVVALLCMFLGFSAGLYRGYAARETELPLLADAEAGEYVGDNFL